MIGEELPNRAGAPGPTAEDRAGHAATSAARGAPDPATLPIRRPEAAAAAPGADPASPASPPAASPSRPGGHAAGTRPPPCGFEFLGAKPAPGGRWWSYPCPACCRATVALVPYRGGWRLASEIGCSGGCSPPLIEWWQAWRNGDLPPPPPPDGRARRYALAAVRRIVGELPQRPTLPELRRAGFACGGWLEAGDLQAEPVALALLAAADRAGIDAVGVLAAAVTAGRARPPRIPS